MSKPQSFARSSVSIGSPIRDRALDGWRGLAALGVVVAHFCWFAAGGIDVARPSQMLQWAGHLANVSVLLFFTISGYVITSLLAREERDTGHIGFRAFYLRRSCRILPPLAAYLIVLVLLDRSGMIRVHEASLVKSSLFLCNLGATECDWWTGHTWSLAVEEQFYLVWPLLFVIAGRWRRVLLAGLLVGMMVLMASAHILPRDNALAFACISAGALLGANPGLQQRLRGYANVWAWLLLVLVLINPDLAARLRPLVPLIALYVVFAGKELRLMKALLESRPLQIAGTASYSIYIWQELFLGKPEWYFQGVPPLVLLPVVVWASVVWIERPSIALGRRLSRAVSETRPVYPATA